MFWNAEGTRHGSGGLAPGARQARCAPRGLRRCSGATSSSAQRRARRQSGVRKVTPGGGETLTRSSGRRTLWLRMMDRVRRRRRASQVGVVAGRVCRATTRVTYRVSVDVRDVLVRGRSGVGRHRSAGRHCPRAHRASRTVGDFAAYGRPAPFDLRNTAAFTPRPTTRCRQQRHLICALKFCASPRFRVSLTAPQHISQSLVLRNAFSTSWSPGILSHDLCAGYL